jgi:hypothetical protein
MKNHPISHQATTTKKKTNPQQVRFDAEVRGVVFEFTQQDLEETWHSGEQSAYFEEQMRADAKLARLLLKKRERGESLDTLEAVALEATPTRGIEQLLSKRAFVDRTTKQRSVVVGVIAAQHRQLAAEDIAIVSSNLSLEARHRALSNGIFDATEAAN